MLDVTVEDSLVVVVVVVVFSSDGYELDIVVEIVVPGVEVDGG